MEIFHLASSCRFLVIVNGIAAAYSLAQVLRCVVNMVRGNALFSKPLAWAIFSVDQVHCILDFFIFYFYFYDPFFWPKEKSTLHAFLNHFHKACWKRYALHWSILFSLETSICLILNKISVKPLSMLTNSIYWSGIWTVQ